MIYDSQAIFGMAMLPQNGSSIQWIAYFGVLLLLLLLTMAVAFKERTKSMFNLIQNSLRMMRRVFD